MILRSVCLLAANGLQIAEGGELEVQILNIAQ